MWTQRSLYGVGLVECSLSASNSIFLQPASAGSNLTNPSWIFASPPPLPEAGGGKMLWAVIASKYAALESKPSLWRSCRTLKPREPPWALNYWYFPSCYELNAAACVCWYWRVPPGPLQHLQVLKCLLWTWRAAQRYLVSSRQTEVDVTSVLIKTPLHRESREEELHRHLFLHSCGLLFSLSSLLSFSFSSHRHLSIVYSSEEIYPHLRCPVSPVCCSFLSLNHRSFLSVSSVFLCMCFPFRSLFHLLTETETEVNIILYKWNSHTVFEQRRRTKTLFITHIQSVLSSLPKQPSNHSHRGSDGLSNPPLSLTTL